MEGCVGNVPAQVSAMEGCVGNIPAQVSAMEGCVGNIPAQVSAMGIVHYHIIITFSCTRG